MPDVVRRDKVAVWAKPAVVRPVVAADRAVVVKAAAVEGGSFGTNG